MGGGRGGGKAYAALQTTSFQMKSYNETETPNFALLYVVFVFKGKIYRFYSTSQ